MKNEIIDALGIKIKKIVLTLKPVTIHLSPLIIVLKFRLKILENRINAIDDKKIELEKLLSDFQNRHSRELGDILLEILRLRTLLFKSDKAKFEEAKKDEKQYHEQVIADKKQKKLRLNEDEKKELKKKFRMASVLCHPDKVNEALKEAAKETFILLKEAYDSNDLKKVTEILSDLEKGNYFKSKSEIILKKELLKSEITKLRNRIKSLNDEIQAIKNSNAYKTVVEISDWDSYFRKRKEILERELKEMKKQINI